MKKTIVLIIGMISILAGCNNNEPKTEIGTAISIEREASTTTTTAPVVQVVEETTTTSTTMVRVIKKAVVTTTTTTMVPVTTTTTVPKTPYQLAQESIGKSKSELGFTDFWCAEAYRYFVSHKELEDSPSQMRLQLEKTDSPEQGDAVFIDLIPEMKTGQTTHVAMFVSFNEDGSINTIEGNGQSEDVITIGVRYPNEIVSFGKAPK